MATAQCHDAGTKGQSLRAGATAHPLRPAVLNPTNSRFRLPLLQAQNPPSCSCCVAWTAHGLAVPPRVSWKTTAQTLLTLLSGSHTVRVRTWPRCPRVTCVVRSQLTMGSTSGLPASAALLHSHSRLEDQWTTTHVSDSRIGSSHVSPLSWACLCCSRHVLTDNVDPLRRPRPHRTRSTL